MESKKVQNLLHGQEAESLWGDIGLIKGEYDEITHDRLIEFVKAYPVKDITISQNSYGKFMFISLQVKRMMLNGKPYFDCFQLWGNGFHNMRGVMMVNYQINMGNYFLIKDKKTINKRFAIAQINDYRSAMGIISSAKQTKGVNRFTEIAD